MRSVVLVGYMSDHIVDALVFVQFRFDVVLIGIILHDEFNVGIVALGVGEELYQLYGVSENVRVVNQRVVVILRRTLPKHDNFIGITGIAVNNGIIRVHGGLVSDTDGAVGVTGVYHGGTGVNALVGVDLVQTLSGHFNGHNGLILGGAGIGHIEVALGLIPAIQQIGAGGVGEELNENIVLVIAQTGRQRINKRQLAEVGTFAGNGGERGEDLVVDDVAVRSGSGAGIAIGDVVGGTLMLAGVVHIFPQTFGKGRNAGQVFRINGHIVEPTGTAIGGIGAGNGTHRNAEEEGGAGGSDHFRTLGLGNDIKTQIQIVGLRLTVGIGQGHCGTAIIGNVGFQCVLNGGGIVLQSLCQSVNQDVALIVVFCVIQMVCIGITISAIFQPQSSQQVCTNSLVDAIQNFNMVIGSSIVGGLGVLNNVTDAQVCELDALHGITVANLAIAKISAVIIIAGTFGLAQSFVDVLVVYAGGDVGGIPHTILFRVCKVVFIQSKAALGIEVNGCVGDISSMGGGDTGNDHHDRKAHGQNLFDRLHNG